METFLLVLIAPPWSLHSYSSVPPNRIVQVSSLSLGFYIQATVLGPSRTFGYRVNYPVPQDSHSSWGKHGSMAQHSFNQFKKTTNHTSTHITGYFQLHKTLMPNFFWLWGGELSTLFRKMLTFPPSCPPNERLYHVLQAKLQPFPRDNLRYIQKSKCREHTRKLPFDDQHQ